MLETDVLQFDARTRVAQRRRLRRGVRRGPAFVERPLRRRPRRGAGVRPGAGRRHSESCAATRPVSPTPPTSRRRDCGTAAEAAAGAARGEAAGTRVVALTPQRGQPAGRRRPCSPRPSRSGGRSTSSPAPMPPRAKRAARSRRSRRPTPTPTAASRSRTPTGCSPSDDQVRTRLMVQCVATGDTGMQTGYEAPGRTMGFELFDEIDPEDVGRAAAQRAVTLLDAVPAPSGKLPVVLRRGAGGVLFHEACGHGLEADHILKDASRVHRPDRRTGRVAVRHARRRRRVPARVGNAGDRRRGPAGPTQRADRERRAHRLHVGPRARPQGGARAERRTAAARRTATFRCRA